MKKLFFLLSAFISVNAFAAGWETITGNGNVKKETRNASGYSAVSLSGNMNVQVAYGNANSITVEADENLLPYIETLVDGEKLVVRTKKGYNLKTKTKMMVNVSLTRLTAAHLSGSGNINGSGNFNNKGETDISISGSGNVNLGFDRFDKLNVKVSGSGNAILKGISAGSVSAQVSGSGNIDCSTVRANNAAAHISGSGNVKVYADESIEAKVAGSGNVFYKGDATNIVSKSSGSGKVIKVK